MALKTGALTTLSRVKDRMDISVSDNDTQLEQIINGVTRYIENRTGRAEHTFEEQTITKEQYNGSDLSGHGRAFLFLKSAPLERSDITLFEYDNGTNDSPNWNSFLNNEYHLVKPDQGVISVDGGLPSGMQNVRISYTAGYLIDFNNPTDTSKHTLPKDLTELAERLVVKFYKRRKDDGRRNVDMTNSSVEFDDYLDAIDEEVMANYQLMWARV